MTHSAQTTVSIILPAYNSATFLQTTLNSIFSQDYSDFEIIIVDDGSTDTTAQIARQQERRVRLIQQKNQGISEARNTGLKAARGRYIAFIDHDDFWHPKKLSAQVSVLEKMDETTGVCYGDFAKWDDQDAPEFANPDVCPDRWVSELSGWIYHQLLLTNWVLFSTALFRRTVFDTIGTFDRELPPADDWDLVLRASRRFKFVKLRDVVALYRQHSGQTSRQCPPRDFQGELRESMILRYGAAGPDGTLPDPHKLRDRRIRSHLTFCTMQALSGSTLVAAQALTKAFLLSPLDLRVARCTFSLVKAIFLRMVK